MGSMVETADWAALDPDFAAGKRAIVAGEWSEAITALTNGDRRNQGSSGYRGIAKPRGRVFHH